MPSIIKNSSGKIAQKDKAPLTDEVFDWLKTMSIALVIILLLFVFLARGVVVIGSSMNPTLAQGDRVIITNLFYTAKYGDIVVLRQNTFRDEPLIKRVIATEGQKVDIDFDLGIVYVDDMALDEPYTAELTRVVEDFRGPITVPKGCVFVMGDNRNHSSDSRAAAIGCVDTRNLLGKVIWQLYPFSDIGFVR